MIDVKSVKRTIQSVQNCQKINEYVIVNKFNYTELYYDLNRASAPSGHIWANH